MRTAFVHFSLFLDDLQIAKIGKFLLKHGPRVEVFQPFRSAGAVLQLLRRVALDDQKSAGLQRAPHPSPFYRAFRRQAELRENFDHNGEGRLWIIPAMHIGLNESDLHTSLGGEGAGLVLRGWRKIKREHIQALLREPHAVSALTVRNRERPAVTRQQRSAGFEKVIRLLAERIVGRRKTRFPARVFVHLFVN